MISLLIPLCLSLTAIAAQPLDVDEPTEQQATAVVQVVANVDGNTPRVVKVVATPGVNVDSDVPHAVDAYTVALADGDESKIHVYTKAMGVSDSSVGGWLGVALGEVRTGDASESTGVRVLNVVKDSPAEKAGLLENDVVVSINDEQVSTVGDLAGLIQGLEPGTSVGLEVLRDGETVFIDATLGERKNTFQWRYTPDIAVNDRIRIGSKAVKVTPGGNVQFFQIGDDDAEGCHLPGTLSQFFGSTAASASYSVKDGETSVTIVANNDGQVVEISHEGNGPIVVTKYQEDEDDKDVTEYTDADALREGDPDAFKIYDQTQTNVIVVEDGHNLDFDFDFNVDDWLSEEFGKKIQVYLSGSASQLGEIESHAEEVQRAIQEAVSQMTSINTPSLSDTIVKIHELQKATETFDIDPDGAIKLTIRKGGTEVIRNFRDADDLMERDPKAYDKYSDVLDSMKE